MRRFSQAMAWPEEGGFAIDAALDERMAFVRKTYSTLFIQLIGVALATSLMVKTGLAEVDSPMHTQLPGGTEDWRMAHITADVHREPDPVRRESLHHG